MKTRPIRLMTVTVTPASQAQAAPGLMIYRFTHSMYYANCEQLAEEVTKLDASAVDDVDYTAAETLRSLHAILMEKGVRLVVAQVMEDVKAESRYNLGQVFGKDVFFETLEEMLQAYRRSQEAGA